MWSHSQMTAPNWPVQTSLRVDRLGAWVVTCWVVGLTAHSFDSRSIGQYNYRIVLPGCYLSGCRCGRAYGRGRGSGRGFGRGRRFWRGCRGVARASVCACACACACAGANANANACAGCGKGGGHGEGKGEGECGVEGEGEGGSVCLGMCVNKGEGGCGVIFWASVLEN